MFKKITIFISMFYINSAFAETQPSLTPQETKIYDAIKKEYKNMNSIYQVDNFLKKNNVSIQGLLNLLRKKRTLLNEKEWELTYYSGSLETSYAQKFIHYLFPPKQLYGGPAAAGALGMAIVAAIAGPLVIGIPSLMLGFGLQHFMQPASTTRKIISYGLIGTGSLLSMPATFAGLFLSADAIEKNLKKIIYTPKLEQLKKVSREESLVFDIILKLKQLYPELK